MVVFDSICYEKAHKTILKNVDLKIQPDQVCGLFGLNGSGKSTLLKIGAGLLLPTSGTVSIGNEVYRKKSVLKRYKKLAYLPEQSFLPPDMRVQSLIQAFPLESKSRLQDATLSNLIDQKVGYLSRGELRYLELTLILSLDRPFVLLDDPFTGIEPVIIEKMAELIMRKSRQGKGVLMTDHYYRDVSTMAGSAYFMKNGECEIIDSYSDLKGELADKGYLTKAARQRLN